MIESELKKLQQGQQELKEMLAELNKPSNQKILYTNDDLMQILKVSRRTLANWRNQGLIGLSQVGSKIYYSQTDVEEFMQNHYCEPFNQKRRAA